MLTATDLTAESAVFDGLEPRHLEVIASCAWIVRFPTGTTIGREGYPADHFYAVVAGRATLQIDDPERGTIIIQTLRPRDLLGWFGLFPPYRWQLNAVAQEPVAAIAFDAICLRGKCEEDHELGYQLMRKFSELMTKSLVATRRQLVGVHAHAVR
jgi:CRP/FNR family transcriptional regulator, cyclic AMP receptor protein